MFAIPGLLAIECGMPQHIGTSGAATKVTVTIDAGLKKKCPRTALACVTARVEAGASSAALLEEMKMRENEIQKLPFPRGMVAGKGLPEINAVVDVINLVSVESRLPVGLYDLGRVVGEIVFRAGRAGETYKGIGKYDLNLEGLPLFADTVGPHGSATSDSERTMVTSATKQVLAIIVSFSGTEGLERWAQRMAALLTQHAAGQNVEIQIIQ